MAITNEEASHIPVLLDETVRLFDEMPGGIFIDATLGLGGHSEAILRRHPDIRSIGIDQDPAAIAEARKRLEPFGDRVRLVHANFSKIANILSDEQVRSAAGILADLGVSSLQLDSGERGFSFRFDAPLDMRMDTGSGRETAAEILATRSEREIADIIYTFGEERESRRIARRIVWKREIDEPIETTKQLADAVIAAKKSPAKGGQHPATQTFQALRIAVNGELEILDNFLSDSFGVLEPGGILAVISFHSLEDRIVKRRFERFTGKCICPKRLPVCACGATALGRMITRKPIVPSVTESQRNPRARSAKLRAIKKL
ncbi:MAG TPA: 16S rRNA (cytosine(1402)-N(4))-methyltransferase RsmH [Pyrinomonadaceae bacterium]|nr:16S rRNA (cytosine(1402)-N(4))-methyltransferase RsmH [Pyrinomonadaceae bacterium]HMP67071.1 16S rRNA (cytosine(1402)-N(4))-methyltransferase RsmH [Pyrinomonadaceae bacterium]